MNFYPFCNYRTHWDGSRFIEGIGESVTHWMEIVPPSADEQPEGKVVMAGLSGVYIGEQWPETQVQGDVIVATGGSVVASGRRDPG